MNENVQKKEYEAPQMTVVKVDAKTPLLSNSGNEWIEENGFGEID